MSISPEERAWRLARADKRTLEHIAAQMRKKYLTPRRIARKASAEKQWAKAKAGNE